MSEAKNEGTSAEPVEGAKAAEPVKVPSGTRSAVKEFLDAHGGKASAVIQPLGRIGVRLTLVGEDGILGDQVVPDVRTAKAVVDSFPEITVSEWDRALTSIVTPMPGHDRKMAGWVANT
jgi:hypothetical protein